MVNMKIVIAFVSLAIVVSTYFYIGVVPAAMYLVGTLVGTFFGGLQ